MAIFTPGPTVASVSGSIGGTVYSHNRGGPYMRNRSIPVTSQTTYSLAARSRMQTASAAWQGLTDGQRAAWLFWAVANPQTNALGKSIQLTGQQAYVSNSVRMQIAAETPLTTPPIIPAPVALTSAAQDGDIGVGEVELVFAATPLAAGDLLWMYAAVTNSAGINYVQNLLRLCALSAKAQATPWDNKSAIEDRIGTLVVDQKLTVFVRVMSTVSGLISAPIRSSVIVDTT